jgi:hypothetical protein
MSLVGQAVEEEAAAATTLDTAAAAVTAAADGGIESKTTPNSRQVGAQSRWRQLRQRRIKERRRRTL